MTHDKGEALTEVLGLLYSDIRRHQDKVSTIQNWCLTVWVVTLTAGSSSDLNLNTQERLALSLLAIGTFWLLAAFQDMFKTLQAQRARRIENLLVSGDTHAVQTRDLQFLGGYESIPYSHKWRVLVESLFVRETVTTYFALLALATLCFQWFLG